MRTGTDANALRLVADPACTANLLQPYTESIFQLLHTVYQDPNRTEALLRSSMGVVGDISEAFPQGEFSHYFRNDWLTAMARDTRANKDFAPRTQETARWAREQIKRQAGKPEPPQSPPATSGWGYMPFGSLKGGGASNGTRTSKQDRRKADASDRSN